MSEIPRNNGWNDSWGYEVEQGETSTGINPDLLPPLGTQSSGDMPIAREGQLTPEERSTVVRDDGTAASDEPSVDLSNRPWN